MDKEGYYIMMNGSILPEDVTMLNMCVPINSMKLCEAQTQWLQNSKGKIDESTIIVGDFNTPLPEMDRFSRQKIS